jgi:hypothetical protein
MSDQDSPDDFMDLTWDDDAGAKRVYPVLEAGKYGLQGEAELTDFGVRSGTTKKGDPYSHATLRVQVTHPDLGVVNVYDGGAFGPFNTNFASQTNSLWPAFARSLGVVKGMKPVDIKGMLPMKVIVDVRVNEYDAVETDPETQAPVKVKRRNNIIAGIQRA